MRRIQCSGECVRCFRWTWRFAVSMWRRAVYWRPGTATWARSVPATRISRTQSHLKSSSLYKEGEGMAVCGRGLLQFTLTKDLLYGVQQLSKSHEENDPPNGRLQEEDRANLDKNKLLMLRSPGDLLYNIVCCWLDSDGVMIGHCKLTILVALSAFILALRVTKQWFWSVYLLRSQSQPPITFSLFIHSQWWLWYPHVCLVL